MDNYPYSFLKFGRDHYNSGIYDMMLDLFYEKFGKDAVPVDKEDFEVKSKKVKYLGKTPIMVNKQLFDVYRKSRKFPNEAKLWNQLNSKIFALPEDYNLTEEIFFQREMNPLD
eukprot:Pgem_evm2s3568